MCVCVCVCVCGIVVVNSTQPYNASIEERASPGGCAV